MDFFLTKELEARYLKQDTTWMGQDNRTKDSIITEQKQIRTLMEAEFSTQKTITANWQESYSKLSERYDKSQKRLRIFKNISLISASTAILLGAIIVLIK